ncbi:alpha/beta hydrolase [Priestia endophytica]
MRVEHKIITIDKKEVSYTHIQNGGAAVCFMLSGSGYTYEKPLFYYSTMTMLQSKRDVVHIHYSYEKDILNLSVEEITNIMVKEIIPVIEDVRKNNYYTETMFLGKSLGTIPLIDKFMKTSMYKDSPLILLTPLLDFDCIVESLLMGHHQTLIIIGEKDVHYIPGAIEKIKDKSNIEIEVLPHANHSLDADPMSTSMSIGILDQVTEKVEEFLG